MHDGSPHTDLGNARILVTGGAGFIGSNFIRYVLGMPDFRGAIINLDKLTYAGNLLSLDDIDKTFGNKRYFFEHADICNYESVKAIFKKYAIDVIVHCAAESHVDRSIFGPKDFIETNIIGTFTLLETAREVWADRRDVRFHHISTDEVYGSLGETGYFHETTPYDPRSPYSASKASSDHLVMAYYHTYSLPVTLSNCSNNYGPYQFPEKLIPLMVLNAVEGKPMPVYGDGTNIRDWLHVEDHCAALWLILNKGKTGETYAVGGECEKKNREVVNAICDVLEEIYPLSENRHFDHSLRGIKHYKDFITSVPDRPGHDRRYAINCDKIKSELHWTQKYGFEEGLRGTVSWYLKNAEWVNSVRSGEYARWMEKNYTVRGR